MVRRLLKKTSEARRAINRSFGLAQDRLPEPGPEIEMLDKCITPLLHHSITPVSTTLERGD
jgi:hypothetical protein